MTRFNPIKPIDAYHFLNQNTDALLIDVRTKRELDLVGKPKINGHQYFCIEWQRYPDGQLNDEFIDHLLSIAHFDTPLIFLCRSAFRSKAAATAAIAAGFKKVYDVEEGFEGQANIWGERQTIDGWCFHQLPIDTL